MTAVGRELVEQADAVHAIDVLTHDQRIAKLPPGGHTRFVGHHATTAIPIGEQIGVGFELAPRFLVDVAASKCEREGAHEPHDPAPHIRPFLRRRGGAP